MSKVSEFAAEPDVQRLAEAHSHLRTDPGRARIELGKLVELGSVMSMLYLGYAAQHGVGQDQDAITAERWYKRAYETGSLMGLTYYGRLLFKLERYEEAATVFQVGEAENDPSSMYWLARVYLLRNNKDARAILMLQRSAGMGHMFAQRALVGMMLTGQQGWMNKIAGAYRIVVLAIRGSRKADRASFDRDLL